MSRRNSFPMLRFGVLLILILLFACTEKTYVTNPPAELPDLRPPQVEWISVTLADSSADLNRHYLAVGDTVTLTVSATDASGIDSLKIYINGFSRIVTPPPAPPASEGGNAYPPQHWRIQRSTLSKVTGRSVYCTAWRVG